MCPFFSFTATPTLLVPLIIFFLCIIPLLLDNIAPNNISSCLVPLLAGLLLEHLRPLSVLMLELLLDVLKLLQLLLPHPDQLMLLGGQPLEDDIESRRGLHAVGLEALDAEGLDGGAQAVEAGLHPGLLYRNRLVWVGGTLLIDR